MSGSGSPIVFFRVAASDFFRLWSFGAFGKIELDFLTLVEGPIAILSDLRIVNKDVTAAILSLKDKAVPFVFVEPLYFTS